jgi:hypothetical protein
MVRIELLSAFFLTGFLFFLVAISLVFTFDGRDQARESDTMAVGKVKLNCIWSKDGKDLILSTLIEHVPQVSKQTRKKDNQVSPE